MDVRNLAGRPPRGSRRPAPGARSGVYGPGRGAGGGGEDRPVMARRRRRAGLFDLVMLLILAAVVWLFLGQAGLVPPLPIGR